MNEIHDVVVVGAGAAGGWAAKELAEAGLSVALLDAGAMPPVGGASGADTGFRKEHYAIQSTCEAFQEATHSLFVDDLDNPYTTPDGAPFHWIRARAVGGRMLVWDGVCLRLAAADLKDWPLSYDELAPFYAEVERFIGVTGTADGLPQLPDGELLPPLPLNPFAQHFKSAVEARWHDRHVVALRRAVHGHDRVLAAALATGRVTLRPNAVVRRVLVDPGGKATGVAFVDRLSKNEEQLRGRIVVLCASTIESTRILLNSGLASSSGVLGHYLMDHSFLSGVLRCKPPQVTPSDPTSASASRCYIPRFRAPRGYGIELAISTPNAEGTCDVEYGAIGEVVGAFENSVSVNEGQRDAWGIPTAHISYAYSGEDDAMVHDAAEAMRAMLEAAGFETLGGSTSRFAAGLSAHEMGTARMGSDPTTSVLDPWNRTWDCGNLFVTDAASFASGGCQNPTLTIMAMTVRACRYIVEQTKSGQL